MDCGGDGSAFGGGGSRAGLKLAGIDLLAPRNTTAPSERDAHWAVPMQRPGLPNLHQVSKDLYRGAQPTAEGMAELKNMGVRTVVNLRSFHSDRDEIGATGLAYEHIYMKAWRPEEKELVRFLQIVTDPQRLPAFVHCQHGADRTGTMCAVYRIVVQGWSKQAAVAELREGGFGFYEGWQNLVDYINALDVQRLAQESGVRTGGSAPPSN
jgi:protein tyrosine phosphatase (PTP) superfamily phosphohydrolase (DUF442 family)